MVSIGFIAGIAFVYSCGGSSSSAATTITEYLSLNGAAFQPKNDGYDYAFGADGIWNLDGISDGFETSVNLPNGATINSVTVYWTDSDAVDDLTFQLRHYSPATENLSVYALGTSNGTATMGSTVDDTITEPIVDNINGTYTLLLTIPTSNIIFRQAIIEYTYTI